jgi:hypothetical protein
MDNSFNRFEILKEDKFQKIPERVGCYAKWKIKDRNDNFISTIIFGVPELECSVYANRLQEQAEEALTSFLEKLDLNKQLESVYYFEYTGDHFILLTSMPRWAKLS